MKFQVTLIASTFFPGGSGPWAGPDRTEVKVTSLGDFRGTFEEALAELEKARKAPEVQGRFGKKQFLVRILSDEEAAEEEVREAAYRRKWG